MNNSTITSIPHYIAKSQNGWGIGMTGLEADDGSALDHAGIIGLPMTGFKIAAKNIAKARVRNKRGKWLPYGTGFDSDLGDGTNITGIEIIGSGYVYAIHIMGGQWMTGMITSDIEGEVLATNGATIDAIWIDKI